MVSFMVGYLKQEKGKCAEGRGWGHSRSRRCGGEKILYPAEDRTACHLSVVHSVANMLY